MSSFIVADCTSTTGYVKLNISLVICFLCLICPQDLMKDLKSELSKNLERLIIGLMLTPAEFNAKMMRKAMEVQLIQITFC